MIIGRYNKSVYITYLGVAIAVSGMLLAIKHEFTYAIICLMAAGICDILDGRVARKLDRDEEEKEFGVQIDSLADMTSFGAFPAVLAFCMGMTKWYHLIIIAFFVICAVIRLGYFNVHKLSNGYYTGLPVTSCSIIFPFFYCFSFAMSGSVFIALFSAVMLATSILNILRVKIKKLTGKGCCVLSLLAIIAAVLMIIFGDKYDL